MKNISSMLIILSTVLPFISCKNSTSESQTKAEQPTSIIGDYATADYNKRSEGYDFVAVSITSLTDSTAQIAVRSRADIKKPTCRFDAVGVLQGKDTVMIEKSGEKIYFTLHNDTLNVSSPNMDGLYYYCSGGASLNQDYIKLTAPLDETLLDKRSYTQVLNYNNISFDVEVVGDTLTVTPYGLEITNEPQKQNIEGYTVVNAEVGDLNIDGYPEIFVYLTSDGSGSYGKLIGYSVNNGKSMSQVCMSDIADNKKLNEGYMGHDEMAMVESTFCQRFPIYKAGDTNAKPTGGTRQVQYKLVDGENCRTLKVDKVVEY